MKNMLGEKKILQIKHNPTVSQRLTRHYCCVKSNGVLVLNAVWLRSSSGLINSKTSSSHSHEFVIEFFRMQFNVGKETRIKCFKQISAFKQEKLVEIKYK